jgi:hypothetical protein
MIPVVNLPGEAGVQGQWTASSGQSSEQWTEQWTASSGQRAGALHAGPAPRDILQRPGLRPLVRATHRSIEYSIRLYAAILRGWPLSQWWQHVCSPGAGRVGRRAPPLHDRSRNSRRRPGRQCLGRTWGLLARSLKSDNCLIPSKALPCTVGSVLQCVQFRECESGEGAVGAWQAGASVAAWRQAAVVRSARRHASGSSRPAGARGLHPTGRGRRKVMVIRVMHRPSVNSLHLPRNPTVLLQVLLCNSHCLLDNAHVMAGARVAVILPWITVSIVKETSDKLRTLRRGPG